MSYRVVETIIIATTLFLTAFGWLKILYNLDKKNIKMKELEGQKEKIGSHKNS